MICLFSLLLISCIVAPEPSSHAQFFKALRIKSKADKVVKLIELRRSEGQDVQNALVKARRVKELADQKRLDDADALLDEIMADLKATTDSSKEVSTETRTAVFRPGKIRTNKSDRFGIWTATLEGKNLTLRLSDPKRQMSHPRVSPDKKWIMFTRYNKMLKDGYAYEKGGYKNTEIGIMRLDGTELKTIVGPKPGVLNCNGSWTPDGQSILYLSTDNPKKRPRLYWVSLKTGKITLAPTPDKLKVVSDPHQVDDTIVFPAPSTGPEPSGIWIMKKNGTQARQLTHPPNKRLSKAKGPQHLGDYDPRLSPDGSKVAVMRNYGKDIYHIVVIDVASGEEIDISPKEVAEGVPHWSSDGRLLIFRHVNLKNLKDYGIYTIKPDGTGRKLIPLPRGVLHSPQPNFFPEEGSSPKTRIIFSTEKVKFLD